LYVAVPNSMKPTRPLKKHFFRVVHVSYFSTVSLRNAIGMAALRPVQLIPGDEFEQYEIFALCKKGEEKSPEINNDEFLKQKSLYDSAGSKDWYYNLKAEVVNLMRKMKLIR
jgi:hypothetical protein